MKKENNGNRAGIVVIMIAVLLFCSDLGCKKYLDLKSDAKLVVPTSLQDLQAILDDAGQMNFARSPSFGETCADDFFVADANLNTLAEFGRDLYKWKKLDYRYQNDWSEAYLPVYNSNLCLDLLASIPRTAQNAAAWDNVKGSALFYRSYYLYLLTMQFGLAYDEQQSQSDPGVVLRLTSDFNQRSERSSVSACLERVLSDASDALALLPDIAPISTRPSRSAAYGLMARTALYRRDYGMAMKYADECLKIRNTLMDFNSDSEVLGLDLSVTFKKFNKETIFYSEMYGGFNLHSAARAKIDTVLYASYQTNDLRKRAYFKANGGYQQFKGSYASSASALFSGIAVDEMYLVRAEGRAWNGDLAGAMQDLNLLLKSRWKNTVPYPTLSAIDKQDALLKIRTERRKELLMRSLRWPDIKRYNREGANISLVRKVNGEKFVLPAGAPFFALPLPKDIIDETGMQQN